MLDVGTATADKGGDDDLAVFVDRLAAAGSDRPTALARGQIRRAIAEGYSPPGLRRLAEALAASVGELPPPPRRPSDDASSVVGAMQGNALVVLEDFDAEAVAGAVSALLADGRRVVVTAPTPAELAALRTTLPGHVAGRVVDRLPALPPGELRELRTLLATSTAARRARSSQELPPAATLPSPDEVAQLCSRASYEAGPEATVGMIPSLLADLDETRRAAVTSVANCASRTLGAMRPRHECPWAWALLSDLIYSRHRSTFDQMVEDTAQSLAALDRARQAPPVQVGGALPAGAVDALRRYRDYLEAGGRSRSYFRTPVQRDVQPVLRLLRVGGHTPESEYDVKRAIEHLELGERLARIDSGCATVGIAPPRNEAELAELADGLVRVGAAARSVGALRHDVLFLAANSPLSVPDVDTAEQVARAILDYADHGSAAEARARLDRMAADLAGRCPVAVMAPEHDRAVRALREWDAPAYATAVEALGAARREVQDEARQTALLDRLAKGTPGLAAAWAELGEREPAALGLVCLTSIEALLSAVPEADSADVILVLGAARLGVERLLLAAVAPRMIAVVAPGERPEGAPTLLSVLQRAAALVIRGRAGGRARVVQMPASPSVPSHTPVGQAGA